MITSNTKKKLPKTVNGIHKFYVFILHEHEKHPTPNLFSFPLLAVSHCLIILSHRWTGYGGFWFKKTDAYEYV